MLKLKKLIFLEGKIKNAPKMEKKMGTLEQVTGFFDKYAGYQNKSGRCALDGRYFWKVLYPYPGLIRSEMYFRINILDDGEIRTSPPAWDYLEYFENDSKVRFRLVKIVIDISNDASDNHGSVHSNLLYFDLKKREIIRFEPMMEDRFTKAVNRILMPYLKGMFPLFKFSMRDDHPQLPITEKCPRKGFCAAYTLKAAMLIVAGFEDFKMDRDFDFEEEQIMTFASAIEKEYGLYDNWEEEDTQYGQDNFDHLSLDTVLGEKVLGIAYKDFIDVRRPNFIALEPKTSPNLPMYSAPYYGYTHHYRYAGSRGWGWGRPRWADHEFDGEHGCGCGVRSKIVFPI